MPVDKISEAYKVVKNTNIFIDEADFREQLEKNKSDVYKVISTHKSTAGLFIDEDDFDTSLNLKKRTYRIWGLHHPYLQRLVRRLLLTLLPNQDLSNERGL